MGIIVAVKGTTKPRGKGIKVIPFPVNGETAMIQAEGDDVVTMPVPKKTHKKSSTNGNGGADNYNGVEILWPVVEPSIDRSKIVEAIRCVMNNGKAMKK
jgi:hypothetical protein